MDKTPGEFRWALAPEFVAWSSDRDRKAMPNADSGAQRWNKPN